MKKVSILHGLRATALMALATAILLACASGDEFEGTDTQTLGEPVKAQFTISIPQTASGATRQSDAVVQYDEDIDHFRGINWIQLFPFAAKESTIGATSILAAPISLSQMIIPTPAATVTNYIPDGKLLTNNNAVLFSDVEIPTQTKSFLFYGKAIDKNSTETALTAPTDKFTYGILNQPTFTEGSALNSLQFSPVPIVSASTEGAEKRDYICAYLNNIVQAEKMAASVLYKWSDFSTYTSVSIQSLYSSFITLKAGSSKDVEAAVEDLYNSLVSNTSPVAQAVVNAITNGTYDGTNKGVTITGSAVPYTVELVDALAGYPGDINLPDGAAALTYNASTREFSYVLTNASTTSLNVGDITSYVYPANLQYWVKSDLLVSNSSEQEHYTTSMTWDAATSTGIFNEYKNGDEVAAATRSIIMTAPVQYAVGRFDVRIAAAGLTLEDNPAAGETVNNVDISKLAVTGILIGGQKAVGWNFEPNGSTEYTIYDNIVVSQGATDGKVLTNKAFTDAETQISRTLVLETAGSATEKVNVAVEFVNNSGSDFMGKDHQVIPKGCKFYLVGALDIEKAYNEADATGKTKISDTMKYKVFKQDYITEVEFKVNSLKQAENTIPDLRNPAIELGLSVNLNWQAGIKFKQTFE